MDGTDNKPTDQIKAVERKIKNARAKSWLLQTINPSILVNLRPYKTTKAMWNYVKKVYDQNSSAKRFQLKYEIRITHKKIYHYKSIIQILF